MRASSVLNSALFLKDGFSTKAANVLTPLLNISAEKLSNQFTSTKSPGFKATQLQKLATLIGAPASGRKDELCDTIGTCMSASQKLLPQSRSKSEGSKQLRVLSIDMGIRNLAFSLLRTDVQQSASSDGQIVIDKPQLSVWRRLAVGRESVWPSRPSDAQDLIEPPETLAPKMESFSPSEMAPLVLDCAAYFASLQPTHILIERQRFRTLSSAAVQEWNLRVGMFEAMLWTSLMFMRQRGELAADIQSMSPAKVTRSIEARPSDLGDNLDNILVVEKTSSSCIKKWKIEMVRRILENSTGARSKMSINDDLQGLVSTFTEAAGRKKGQRAVTTNQSSETPKEEKIKKLDDLSDSLLQGLTWLQWHRTALKLNEIIIHR